MACVDTSDTQLNARLPILALESSRPRARAQARDKVRGNHGAPPFGVQGASKWVLPAGPQQVYRVRATTNFSFSCGAQGPPARLPADEAT